MELPKSLSSLKAPVQSMKDVRRASFLGRSIQTHAFSRQTTIGSKAKQMEEKRILIPTNFKINYEKFTALEEDELA